MKRCDHSAARGFTLLEMLLAIVLLGMIMTLAYSGLRGALRATRSGEAAIGQATDLRAAHLFVLRQLERMLPLAYGTTDSGIVVFEGGRDFVRFVAPMPGYLGAGGPHVQELRFVSAVDGDELEFRYAVLSGYQDGDLEAVDPVVLFSGIRDAEWQFIGFDEDGSLTDWQSSWDNSSAMPLAVALDGELPESYRLRWPALRARTMIDNTGGGVVQMTMPRQAFPGPAAGPGPGPGGRDDVR